MTTWAYSKGVLAADTLSVASGIRVGYVRKIWRVGPFLLAAAGASCLIADWRDWIESGMYPDEEPPRVGEEAELCMVGHLFLGGDLSISFEPRGKVICRAPFVAGGSGWEMAMGAMAMGATPKQAVEAAIEFDTSSGGHVDVLRMDKVTIPGLPNKLKKLRS